MKKEEMRNKAQVTIFIILGLLIVIIISLLVLNWDKVNLRVSKQPPIEKLKDCYNQNLNLGKEIIISQGGTLKPTHSYLYKGSNVEYLCYTSEYYKTCIMQKPFLIQDIKEELKDYVEPKIKDCFGVFRDEMKSEGYEVSMENPELTLEIIPGAISTEIKSNLKLTKGDTQVYESINTKEESNLYEMLGVASSILNWEARYGDAEITTYMTYYPNLRVEKKVQGEGTTIYIITDKKTEEVFQFASRSLVVPPNILL
jgi:hypothetical protein